MEVKDLLNKKLNHKKFGEGVIKEFTSNAVVCDFNGNDKLIAYGAFGKKIELNDILAEKLIEQLAVCSEKDKAKFTFLIKNARNNNIKNIYVKTNNTLSKHSERIENSKVVFLNIAWMKNYSGISEEDNPLGGGSYVEQTNDAHESYNFMKIHINNGEVDWLDEGDYCVGFYETKSHGGKRNSTHIESIIGCENAKGKDSTSGVLAIFCAKNPETGTTSVVGWYKDATVFRNYRSRNEFKAFEELNVPDDYYYNFISKANNCVMLTGSERNDKQWVIPRAKGDSKIGFGQANIWYASFDSEKPELEPFLESILERIEQYSSISESDSFLNELSNETLDLLNKYSIQVKRLNNTKNNEIAFVRETEHKREFEFKELGSGEYNFSTRFLGYKNVAEKFFNMIAEEKTDSDGRRKCFYFLNLKLDNDNLNLFIDSLINKGYEEYPSAIRI